VALLLHVAQAFVFQGPAARQPPFLQQASLSAASAHAQTRRQPSSFSRPLTSLRAAADGGEDEDEVASESAPSPPSSSPFPDNRPLNSVEQRRIDRAAKTDKARKLSKNARLMDDFFGKRMGAGTVFYGESLSDMDDETYAKKVEGGNDNDARLEIKALRENPVLVVGATGKTGQWVVTDLLSKGFSVRAFVRNLNKAEDLFGWDGSNLDVFEGNVKDLSALTEAMKGALAVIYCAGSREVIGPNAFAQVDGLGVENAVKAAQLSGEGGVPSVRKFILLSSIGVSKPDGYGFVGKLLGDPLKAKARGEDAVRRGNLESYCIVRAGGLRDGDGTKRAIEIGQGDVFGKCGVSRLDVAQMLVQALVQDVNNVTFEVKNDDSRREDQGRLNDILATADQRQIVEYFLTEDARDEEMWGERLSALKPDVL
jgi:uncharacterized protein YbjT (DUF2867 family)